MKEHVPRLKTLLPNSIVTCKPSDLTAYRDIGYPGSDIGIIVRPHDYHDIGTLLSYCNEHGIALTPWGGGTNLCGALTPSREFIALDMKSLNAVLHFSPGNSQVTVQAGATIEKVERYLSTRGFMFPHDPWSLKSSTIGGAISLDSAGNFYPKFGSIRHQVLSLKVMLADGRIIDIGKNLTKSSASPFLPSLFIGAEGHFGIVLEATFTVHRSPAARATLGFAFSSFQDLFRGVIALKDAGVEPQSYIGGTVPSRVEMLQSKAERVMVRLLKINSALFLSYDGLPGEVTARRERAVEILSDLGRKMPQKYPDEWWENRHTYFEMSPELAVKRIYVHVFDLCVPPSRIMELAATVEDIAHSLGVEDRLSHTLFCAVDAYTIALYVDDDKDGREVVRQCERKILHLVHEVGGSITRTHGLGTLFPDDVGLKEIGEDGLFLLGQIRRILDPRGILNPGILHRRM